MSDADNNRRTNNMRTIRTKVYTFDELNDDAKQKAIDHYRQHNDWLVDAAWDYTKEDAEEVGLIIHEIGDHLQNKGEFKQTAELTAREIIDGHGPDCETYKTAQKFLAELAAIEEKAIKEGKDGDEDYWYSDEIEELENEFLHDILEDYRIIFNQDCEFQNSDEYISENIQANNYEFTADGKMI